MTLRCDEAHPFPRPSASTSACNVASSASPLGPLGPPTTTSWASGMDRDQKVEGREGDIRPLQRLDAPDEQQQGAVTGKAERPSRVGTVAGREESVVDPERHDLDPVRVGPVQLDQLIDLDRSTRREARRSNR